MSQSIHIEGEDDLDLISGCVDQDLPISNDGEEVKQSNESLVNSQSAGIIITDADIRAKEEELFTMHFEDSGLEPDIDLQTPDLQQTESTTTQDYQDREIDEEINEDLYVSRQEIINLCRLLDVLGAKESDYTKVYRNIPLDLRMLIACPSDIFYKIHKTYISYKDTILPRNLFDPLVNNMKKILQVNYFKEFLKEHMWRHDHTPILTEMWKGPIGMPEKNNIFGSILTKSNTKLHIQSSLDSNLSTDSASQKNSYSDEGIKVTDSLQKGQTLSDHLGTRNRLEMGSKMRLK